MRALCGDLPIGHFGVAGSGKSAVTEGRESKFITQAGRTNDFLHFSTHVRQVYKTGLWPCRTAIPPSPAKSSVHRCGRA